MIGALERPRIVRLVEALVEAQRALTRAVLRRDDAFRRESYRARETAARELVEYVQGIEREHREITRAHDRAVNEITQLRFVLQLARIIAPSVVSEAEGRFCVRVALPDAALCSFDELLTTAVTNGHAKRLEDGTAGITYAGLQELDRAARTRDQLDEARTELFNLQRARQPDGPRATKGV